MTVVADRRQLSYIAAQAADARVNIELETEDMTLNIGPQHPATHGTLRIIAKLDGEQVVSADPVMGYMHRGYEKLTEVRTFPQVTTLINRIDWLGSFANEVPFILAAEKLMDIEAPPRAQHIRTILFELSRIANISLQEFWRYQWPIFLTMLFALALCTVFPPLTTWLPNLVMPTR